MWEIVIKSIILLLSIIQLPYVYFEIDEPVEEDVIIQGYQLEVRPAGGSSFDYVLISQEGEEILDVFNASLSNSKTMLAFTVLDPFRLKVRNLDTKEIMFDYEIPGNAESLSGLQWSPDDTHISFSFTYLTTDQIRKTRYGLINVSGKLYYIHKLPIAFHVGAIAYSEPLIWAPDSSKTVTITYPGANQYEDFHSFTIIDKNGTVLNTVNIPKDNEEFYGIWPEEYKFSDDGTKIIYKFTGDEEWRELQI